MLVSERTEQRTDRGRDDESRDRSLVTLDGLKPIPWRMKTECTEPLEGMIVCAMRRVIE